MNRVFILGGGVAGLTAAHELVERGFTVTVFEKNGICGGKARSMANPGSGTGGNKDWPAEHGFRFFPGFYWHLNDTMSRIWFDQANNIRVVDNLVAADRIGIAQVGHPLFRMQAGRPSSLAEWAAALLEMFSNPELGVPLNEAAFFVKKLFCFLGSGPSRRQNEYEGKSWWDFTEAATKSTAYQNVLVRGLSRSLVAMRPDKASTLTVASMLVQILIKIVDPPQGRAADRVLNAPTNDAWIDPWVAQLTAAGATMLNNHLATQLDFDAATKRITGVSVATPIGVQQFGDATDYYLAAVPVEVVQTNATLFSPALKQAAGLVWSGSGGTPMGVDQLQTDWMTGVLFYLNRPAPALKGHVIHATSPWSLTSINQAQFWDNYPWPTRGNGTARDILSTIISDWERVGDQVVTKRARDCTKAEILTEVWAQTKAHMAGEPLPGRLSDADKVAEFIDPAITYDAVTGVVSGNAEPLLINTVHSRQHRPSANTKFDNFFVAADWVKTNTDLACMEAANEAARQAVNGLLNESGSTLPRCAVVPLMEPALFKAFQDLDEQQYIFDPATPPALCLAADQMLALASGSAPSAAPAPTPPASPLDPQTMALLLLGGANLVVLLIILYLLIGS